MKNESEYIEELREAKNTLDNESAHIAADHVLLAALRQLGFAELAAEFETASAGFWYA